MKITRISIRNFRSIADADISCSDFNIFVGQNNAGKTNLFEAIEWFYNGTPKGKNIKDLHNNRDVNRPIVVEVEFSGAIHGAENMRNEVNKTKMLQVLNGTDSIVVRRTSANDGKREVIINGTQLDKPPTGFDKAFNDFLPKFEYVTTRQYFDDFAKYSSKSPIGIMLSSVLEEILSDNPQYRAFREKFDELFSNEDSAVKVEFDRLGEIVRFYLEKQFSECSKVFFEVSSPSFDELLKNFQTRVDDGVETYAYEKGDGMQRALMLAIIQAYADYRKSREDAGKSFLFFIDEAEIHLHPTAQRKLKDVLIELSSGNDQVFLNTHSSVFVADDHQSQLIHKVEKEDCQTSFYPVGSLDKPYVVFELLGGSPADLLLPRNFLIVEGPSEVILLTTIIKRFYSDMASIQIISAEGDTHQAKRSINSIKKAFSPLGRSLFQEKVVILCDHPSDKARAGFDAFIQEFSAMHENGQIHVIPAGSLEECYPEHQDWRKSPEHVANMSGQQKNKLAKRVGEAITQEQFEAGMAPIFNALGACWDKAFA